jgi:hypothetical protein
MTMAASLIWRNAIRLNAYLLSSSAIDSSGYLEWREHIRIENGGYNASVANIASAAKKTILSIGEEVLA